MMKSDLKHIMYRSREAQRTLDSKYMTSYHMQAQWAEFTKLKEVIGQVHSMYNRGLTILDIGIGYARVPLWLSRVATWNKVSKYVGIDISEHCIAQSRRIATNNKIADKVEVIQFDAVDLSADNGEHFRRNKYDLIVCTYFTAGDFKPDQIRLESKKNGRIVDYDINLLKPNEEFVAVFKGAFGLLRDGGKIVIGSIYCDNDLARKVQEMFYRKCGMTVITSERDQFGATLEGFWSERFDEDKIYSYLSWVSAGKIELIPLDDYNFALMIIIDK